MKRLLTLILTLSLCVLALSAERIRLSSGDNAIRVVSSSETETVLGYEINTFDKQKIEINGSEWYNILLPQEGVTQEQGLPQLPVFNRSIIIPNSSRMEIEISDLHYQDFKLSVAPSKGVIPRNINPATVPYTFGKVYEQNAFYPEKIAELSEPYIMRDFRGITVQTTPFAYNPVTQTLRVFTAYKIRVYANGTDTVNTLSGTRGSVSREFSPIYENHFVNWQDYRYTPVNDSYGKLLVICHTNYMSTILPYVNWKKQKGVHTELVEWSTIGTTAAQLQTYIQNRYTADNTITYVQIVGDAPQIPSLSSGGGGSDPSFSLVAGSDNYPDIFIGRFSAETAAQVTAQINKAIVYERDLTTTATWLSQAMGIASAEGGGSTGDMGESDIAHMNLIRTDLLNYGYTSVDQVYDPSASAATVTTNVNAGRGFINYVGHGSDTSWVTTGFSNTNATALTNGNKTPFIMDVACVNGNFVSTTCFAEAWLRNANGGAVAMYASSINQSWNSPMRAQDEATDLLIAEAKLTAGGLYYNASCKMMDIYGNTTGSDGVNMFKTWHIFGDASLLTRTKTPLAMTVTHPSSIITGATSVNVSTGVSNALVAITYLNTIYGRGFTDGSGNVTITLVSPPTGALNYTITATAHNRVTYVGTIAQTVASGPWMEVTSANYADGNNSMAEYNETGSFNVTYHNSGTSAATSVTATLTCATAGITITDGSETIANLNAGASTTINNAYSFNIANNVANGTSAVFTITMVSGATTWVHNFSLTLNAPALAFGTIIISDPAPGNNNGRLDPGETVTVTIPLNNTGGAASPAGNATLTSPTSGITINTGSTNFLSVAAGGSAILSFSISASAGMSVGTIASLVFNATAEAYSASKTETTAVGLILEDFSTGNFSSFPWVMSSIPWTIDNANYYSASYSARSGTIGASASTTMEITRVLSSPGTLTFWYKVSSESGYDFLRFYIDGVQQNQWSGELAWSQATYALTAGTRVLKWEYMKDGSLDTGSDCAWVDDIIFPASANLYEFYPPQNFAANPGNAVVNLTWQTPAYGTPTGYKIFRNSSLLTTVTGLSYADAAVTNGVTYSYYLKAVYSGGESSATPTVTATPNTTVFITIGTGTANNSVTVACPINVYYQSLHGQSVYLASELTALGITGPADITQIGFNVTGLPTLTMPNFIVRMGHTTSTDVVNWISTGLNTVYSNASYLPATTGWNMLTLSTPFTWDGTSNILIDTAYGLIGSYTSSGTTQYTSVTNGYRYGRSDTADQTSVFTGGSTSTFRPNVRLAITPQVTGPSVSTNPTSITSEVYVNESATPTLTVSNNGTAPLTWSTSASFATWGSLTPTSGTIPAGGNTVLTLTLNAAGMTAGTYNANITITSDAANNPSLSVPVAFTVQPSPYPVDPRFVAEWEPATGVIIAYASGFGLPYSAIADLSTRGRVYVVVTSANQSTANTLLTNNGVTMSNVSYINPSGVNSYWTRDYGPWTIMDGNGQLGIVDFKYNRVRPYDDALNSMLDDYLGVDYYNMPLVATGGNVMTDGRGKMMSTNLILSENDGIQNSQVTEYSYTQSQIGTLVQNYLGATEYQFYTDPLSNSSIDHIDCWGKILDVDKVIIARVPVGHSNYAALEAVVAQWQSKVSSYGTPYQIFRVDQSSSNEPYTNSFIFNNKIYVPQWNSTPSSYDTAAIAAYQSAMPGFTVQGFYNSSWLSDDAFHCRVNTVFDKQMIHAWHQPVSSAMANNTVAINVTINHFNPLSSAGTYVAYKHGSAGTWQYAYLTNSSGDFWTASVPTPALGQTLYYYVLATDNTSRTVKTPLCGASDPFKVIVDIPPLNTAPSIALPDDFSFPEDGSLVVDFGPYVSDNETDDSGLSLVCSGNNHVTVSITGLSVTFRAAPDWHGSEVLTFTVSDGELSANDDVNVIVTSVVDPAIITVEPLSLDFGAVLVGESDALEFTIANSGEATLIGEISTPPAYTVSLVSSRETLSSGSESALGRTLARNTLPYSVVTGATHTFSLSFAPTAEADYSANLAISSNDPLQPLINVVLTGSGFIPNSAPEIDLPASFSFAENSSLIVDFSPYVSDADDDPLTLDCVGNTNVYVQINGLLVTFTAAENWDGSEELTFTVSDGEAQNSDITTVIVNHVNRPPTIALPSDFSFDMNTVLLVDFSAYVDDPEGDILDLACSGNSNVLVTIEGLIVTFTATPDWAGSENLTFTVNDGLDEASDAVEVNVILTQLDPPQTVVVNVSSTETTIAWAPVPNALSYEIWGCDDPYGTYVFIARVDTPVWDGLQFDQQKRFYKIIASNQPVTK